jgi:NAD(P)-dependent dehydrogenase (short-subunit alcohol dehydrogenase family)
VPGEAAGPSGGRAGGIAGRSALVTGGGSGIGLATASRFAADGAHVTICGRTEDKLREAARVIAAAATGGAQVAVEVADVTVEDLVRTAGRRAESVTGRLDICFACAGGSFHLGPVLEADAEAVRATVELNLMGSYLTLKHAGATMAAHGGGAVVLMSSGAGHFPHRHLWAYGMAKAGIEALCSSAAEELGSEDIRVNVVQPGIIDDELMSFVTAGGPLAEDYLAQMPLRRFGTVEDVAEAVRFLSGPESSFITGERLTIDGGHHLRRGADYSLLFGP